MFKVVTNINSYPLKLCIKPNYPTPLTRSSIFHEKKVVFFTTEGVWGKRATQSSVACPSNMEFPDFWACILLIFHLFFSFAILPYTCDFFFNLILQCSKSLAFGLVAFIFVVIKAHTANFSLWGIACRKFPSYSENIYLNDCSSVRAYSL